MLIIEFHKKKEAISIEPYFDGMNVSKTIISVKFFKV